MTGVIEVPSRRYTNCRKEVIIINKRAYTKEEKSIARKISIASILERDGHKLKKCGSNYVWGENPDRIYIRGNYWFNHYTQQGGDTIDFLKAYYNLDYPEALCFLIDNGTGFVTTNTKKAKTKALEIPKQNYRNKRLINYLCNYRKIDKAVVDFLISQNMIYETAQHHNIAFVGFDPNNKPKHIHLQGTNPNQRFKMTSQGSVSEYSFHYIGQSDSVYLFESPIDLLSYITLFSYSWKDNSYLASCSVSDRVLFQCLEDYPHLKNIYLCLDNDKAGQKANNRIKEKLTEHGYNVQILIPKFKDWNEDLMKEGELK